VKFVDRPVNRPHTCAIIPGRGAASEKGRWLDTHNELTGWDPHVYISEAGASEVARMIGWVHPEDVAALNEELQVANDRIAELEQELAEADEFKGHMDGLMKHGYVPKRAAGRPPKQKAI
jgi:hypothetical protein